MSAVSPLTIEDFGRLPAELAHQLLRDELITMLLPYVTKHELGRIICGQDYDFGGNALGPDLSFFGREKLRLCEGKLRVQRFVPDLAIEIVSENDTFARLTRKTDLYRKCGTKEAWILDAETRKAFLFSEEGDAILDENGIFQSSLIPGFSIRLGDLFDQL
jgi:Uma2 family endonuclease